MMKLSLNKVSTIIGSAVAGAAAVVAILTWYEAPRGKLRATFVANAYQAPPVVTSPDSLREFSDTSRRVPPAFGKLIGFMNPFPIEGFLDGTVRNEGSKEIERVVLTATRVIYVCAQRTAKDWTCQKPSGGNLQITIGTLAPLESVAVQTWLAAFPTREVLNTITVTHSQGVGKISFESVNVGQARELSAFTSLLLIGVTGILVLSTFGLYLTVRQALRKISGRSSEV